MKKNGNNPGRQSNQYTHMKRPNVPMTLDEHKRIAKYCIDNEMKIGDFLRQAGLYCLDKKIKFN